MSFFYNHYNKAMKEVLETDKQIIERLTREVDELKEKKKKIEELLDDLGVQDNFDGFLNFIKFIYGHKDEFMEFVNIKKNNKNIVEPIKIEEDPLYIELKNSNIEMKKQIDILNSKDDKIDNSLLESKIKEELDKQKTSFDKKMEEQELKYNTLYNNFNALKEDHVKNDIPSPSSSTEKKKSNKNRKKEDLKNNDNGIIFLPVDLNPVVYYRKIVFDKFNPYYFKSNNKCYLSCCGQEYKEKEISNVSNITCYKCYKTYNLSKERNNISNLYEIINIILPKHKIENEEEIYKKIKCNNNHCNYISKKEIDLCYDCKNAKECEIKEYPIPDVDEEGYETKLALAGKTHNTIEYVTDIYYKARKEGLVKSDFKSLIKYIKENNLMNEKQTNIIRNKIIRCYYINKLYNEDKYKDIQSFIKRISFSINSLSKLKDSAFTKFLDDLNDRLDKELETNNNKDVNNEESSFPCKNSSCNEYINMEGIFCNDCKPYVRICIGCDEDFSDEFTDDKKCLYCRDE